MPRIYKKKTHCIRGHERTPENVIGTNCGICMRDQKRAFRKAHPDEHRAQQRASGWKTRQLSKLGWTLDSYELALKEQSGVCAICGKPCPSGRKLAADHVHTVPPIPRGLLCVVCNLMIGYAYDSVEILENAIEYIKKYQTQETK